VTGGRGAGTSTGANVKGILEGAVVDEEALKECLGEEEG